MQSLIVNYLSARNSGHVQMKFSWDIQGLAVPRGLKISLAGLEGICDVVVNESGTIEHLKRAEGEYRTDCRSDKDFRQFAISAQAKNLSPDIVFDKAWNVDSQFCCNTPWV